MADRKTTGISRRRASLELPADFEAVHARHHDVEQDEIGGLGRGGLEGQGAVGNRPREVAFAAQKLAKDAQILRPVVDDENVAAPPCSFGHALPFDGNRLHESAVAETALPPDCVQDVPSITQSRPSRVHICVRATSTSRVDLATLPTMSDTFATRSNLRVGGSSYEIFRLGKLAEAGLDIARLPFRSRSSSKTCFAAKTDRT
jgi:hypothetical protein